jgi:trk system potassium uptake protein TrkH
MFALEHSNPGTMGSLSMSGKIQASIFQSVSPRTAGYYSVPLQNLRMPTVAFSVFLMFIGGSPASTAGGIKTTTFGVLLISIFSYVRGKRDIEAFEKRILPETTIKAAAIVGLSLILVNFVAMILSITEASTGFDYLDMLYETVSAFATVGLTRGLTPELSNAGKLILSAVMLIGRVGPLTVMFAIVKQHKNIGNYTYPEGKIIIG